MAERDKTGAELLGYLKETGTGQGRLEELTAYLRHHPEASAVELHGHMLHARMHAGTIEKAGKWLHGDSFVYVGQDAPAQSPEEEMRSLRKRGSEQADLIRSLEAEKHRLTQRVAQLQGVRLGGYLEERGPAADGPGPNRAPNRPVRPSRPESALASTTG